MRNIILALLLTTSAAAAESKYIWPPRIPETSFLELGEPQSSGAIASLLFQNASVHNELRQDIELSYQGLNAIVHFELNIDILGRERVSVTLPEGYIAYPEFIELQEAESGFIHIFTDAPGV